jgi:hypothetical protein
MRAHAAELISIPVDVLVGNGTPLLKALKALTQTIPIVFAQVADPARTGLVSSYARPDGNITGFADFDASIAGKWMEVLKEAAPFVRRVMVLANPEQPIHREFLREIDAAAPSLKIAISVAEASDRAEIEQAVSALAGQSDFRLDRTARSPQQHTARFNCPVGRTLPPAGNLPVQILRQGRRIAVLRYRSDRSVAQGGRIRRSHPSR